MNNKYSSLIFELIDSNKLIVGESSVFDYMENLTFEELEDIYDSLCFYVNFDELKDKVEEKDNDSILYDEETDEIDWGGNDFEKLTEDLYEENDTENTDDEKLMDIIILLAMIVQLETAKDVFLTQEQLIKYLSIFMIDVSLEMLRREGKVRMIGKSYLTKDGKGTFEKEGKNYGYNG